MRSSLIRSRRVGTSIAAAALFTLAAGACAPATPATQLSSGHIVFDIHLHEGELEAHLGNHESGELWDWNQAILMVPGEASTTIPADPNFAFLGNAGDPVYVLPQNQPAEGPELLHLGFMAEEIAPGTLVDDEVHIELTEVTGPGAVHFYETDDHMGMPLPAPVVHFDSDDPAADTAHAEAGGHHTHGAWAFSAPGQYRLTLQFSGELVGGGEVESTPTPYMFIVG